jgi:hypothetical protein
MQAVEEMNRKNFKKALAFIDASKIWPANLGVGKPYEEDIDLRLEKWMSYICYTRSGNKSATQSALNDILQTNHPYPSANDLVTAWAMEKSTHSVSFPLEWLQERINKYPGNKFLLWSKAVLQNQPSNDILKGGENATVHILEQLKKFE